LVPAAEVSAAEGGDAADAAQQVGELVELLRRDVDAIRVRDPRAVGEEVEALAVRGPLRVDVLALVERGQGGDLAAGHVDRGQPVVARVEVVELRREAVGHERDRLPVRRPRGLQVRERVVGEPPQG